MLDKRIQYFMMVAKEGSFSAAARTLLMAQPSLSQQVSALEEELGVVLFDRQGYRPVLTEAGREFYKDCLRIKEECDQAKRRVLELTHENIRIGFTASSENKELLSLIQKFRKKYPSVTVSFSKTTFEGCVQGLLEKELDVGFGIDSDFKGLEELQYDVLFPFELCVICAHNHPLAERKEIDIHELKDEPFILLSKKFGSKYYKEMMQSFKKDGFSPKIKREVDLLDELLFQVSIEDGIAIVSKNVVRETEVRAIRLVNSHHSSNYAIAYRRDSDNLIMRKFIEETKKYFETI